MRRLGPYVVAGWTAVAVAGATSLAGTPLPLQWTRIADLPSSQHAACAAVIDGRVYIVGGQNPAGPPNLNTMRIYDTQHPELGWVDGPAMPTRRYIPGAAVLEWNGKKELYVVGGYSGYAGLATVERYIVPENRWESAPSLPQNRGHGIMTAVVSGKLYAMGGFYNGSSYYDTNEVYDRSSNSWTPRKRLPVPMQMGLPAVWRDRIYIFGGGGPGVDARMTLMYDPIADTWTAPHVLADAPREHCGGRAVIIGDLIYLVCNSPIRRKIDVYDPAGDVWYPTDDYPGGNNYVPTIADGIGSAYVLGDSYLEPGALECWKGEQIAPKPGISGCLWNDLNGNRVRDTNEPVLPDWVVFLDADHDGHLDDGEKATTTGTDGSYSFADLPPGIYSVAQVLQSGWVQTFPADALPYTVTLTDQPAEHLDFGNHPIGDVNGDGCVNVADLLIVRNHLGQGSCP